MRALHLGFLVHHPYELLPTQKWERGYYGGEASFKKADTEQYQPLLALLERNIQRYRNLRVTLAISGVWLEQAERWDPELIKRVRKMVNQGNVDLVVLPYYYSVAAFFEMEEFAKQVKQMREKLKQLFDYESATLVLPECCYHDRIAKWAEQADFRVIMAGDAQESLAWRNPNRVFAAKGCEDVKVLFQNLKLTNALVKADEKATVIVEKNLKFEDAEADLAENNVENFANGMSGEDKTEKTFEFSAKVFEKHLGMEFLRGDLVNLYFSTRLFDERWREHGIVGFFDELFRDWLETPGCRFVNAKDCEKLKAVADISVKKTASSLGEARRDYALPRYWSNLDVDREHRLYELREKILETGDKDLYVDFARLTTRDYASGGAEFDAIFEDIYKRAAKFSADRMADDQPAKRGMTASTKVKINFDKKAREAKRRREELLQLFREANVGEDVNAAAWNGVEMDDMEATIQVLAQRMQQNPDSHHAYDNLAEAEVVAGDMWMEQESDFDEAEMNVEEAEMEVEPEAEVEVEEEKPPVKKRKKIVIE